MIKIILVALKKNSKLKGCLKRIPDGESGRNKHKLKALWSKLSNKVSVFNTNKGGTTGLISRPLAIFLLAD